MGRKNTTKSALKKSSNIYFEKHNSKFAVKRIFNNLRESKSENLTEVDQCIFLGALCLKPVPDIFQVTLQPISSIQQSNTSILRNNNKNTQIKNREKSHSSRKNKNKVEVSSTVNKNFLLFTENVRDHKFENKILKLIGQVKKSIKEEIVDKYKVNAELLDQSNIRSRKFFEYSIERDTLRKKKLDFHQNLSFCTSKTEVSKNKFSGNRRLLKRDSLKSAFQENKFSDLTITMSSERMKDYENFIDKTPYVKDGYTKLNTNVKNNSSEKDIAVENVIRRLRQKKCIEVKKVQDVDSKLKRISPMSETKPKSEQFDQSKGFIINLDSHQTSSASQSVDEQKISVEVEQTSSKATDFLELEDDDIEDYLEIDQNVVEDLEALIPEEEIVSISNSLIQPETDLSIENVEDTISMSERKPESIDISVKALSEPILISDSSNCKTAEIKSQEVELEMKKDEEIETNIKEQPEEITILNLPAQEIKISPNNKDSSGTITINNNRPLSKTIGNLETQIPINVEPVKTSKRKSEEIIPYPKKKKISPKINKGQSKKRESGRINKSRQDSNASKNLRKITDYFIPDCMKTESFEEPKAEIEKKAPEENSQNASDETIESNSSEILESEIIEVPYKTRTLRSRTILPLETLSELKTKELHSTHVNQVLEKGNNDQPIILHTLHVPKTMELKSTQENETLEKIIKNVVNEQLEVPENNSSQKKCTNEFNNICSVVQRAKSPKETFVQNIDEIQLKAETNCETPTADSSVSTLAENTEPKNKLKSELPKRTIRSNRKGQLKDVKKRSSARTSKISNQPEEINNTQEKEEENIGIATLNAVEKVVLNKTVKNKEVSSSERTNELKNKHNTRDTNENRILPGTSTEKEPITAVETTESSSEKKQITGIVKDMSPEIENIMTIKSANILSKTHVKQTLKRKASIRRKKTVAKIPNETIIETNVTTNIEEEKRNENNPILQNSPSVEVKRNQNKKGKNKSQKRSRNNVLVHSDSLDNNQTIIEQKNKETKLEIYDFDDKSNESVEVLEKSVKRRKHKTLNKNSEVSTDVLPEKGSNFDIGNQNSQALSKKKNETENINNNRPNIKPGSIESFFRLSVGKSSTDFTSAENKTSTKDEMKIVDLNTKNSNGPFPKASPGTEKEIAQFGQDWKPSYGPYKRIDRCNVCLLSFKSYKKLRAHKKIHEVENLYKCWECDDCFEDVEKLAAHLRIHKGKMPYPCKKCDAAFWTSFQLERHQLVHVLKKVPPPSKPPSKVFKCEECGKEFKKICDLERHTRVHTGEKPSVCNICNKRFQQSYNLNKHLYTHTQEKNFECVICQKKFGRNDVLNRHVLTHSIVKPFRCSICSRTFIRNSQLKLHLRKHHGLDEDPGNDASVDDPVAGTSAKV